MRRFPDWHDRLCTYLDTVTDDRFTWGEHDCALFASSAVQRMTGEDIAAEFCGKYHDYKSATAALREYGAGTLLKTVKSKLGEPISPHLAQRGDFVMLDARTCGVCVGEYSWFVAQIGKGEGLVALPTSSLRYAFRVPFDAPVGDAS